MRRLIAAASAFVFVLTLTACNTVEGAGEDIQAAGEGISDAADGDN
ncbi:MAG: entericidin A/B family lipoprotein [Planctomycetota bacterium]